MNADAGAEANANGHGNGNTKSNAGGTARDRSCEELARLLRPALHRHGVRSRPDIAALGVRDAFASPPAYAAGRHAPRPASGPDERRPAPGSADAGGCAPGSVDPAVPVAGPDGPGPAEGPDGGRVGGAGRSRSGASAAGSGYPGAAPAGGVDPGASAAGADGPDGSAAEPSAELPVPVRLYGHHAVVGPLAPGGGDAPPRPCAHCLERRWQAVRSVALREALELGSGTRSAGRLPYLTPFTADALAALIAGLVAGAGPRTGMFPPVHLVDLRSLTVRHYPLVPDPECPDCAVPEKDTPQAAALTLRPAPKVRPGSFRVRDIGDYGLAVEPFANPLCGALGPSVVHDVSSTSTSAAIGCFSMRSGDYLRETFWGGHADSFGHSVRIGVLEGLERYAGMRPRAKRARVTDSLGALRARGVHTVDPRVCGLYSDDFHRANPRVRPFTPDREIPWVWGWSLRDERPVLVPEVLTYYHAPGLENRFVQESSNGCASGGCLEEAVYFGLMEVVERDAFLLAWYGRARLPELDPRTSTRPATRHMVERLEMYGYEARFFDTRISFPVPVVTGVAVRHDGGPGRMCFGAGAGLDPEAALAGALCEIATDAVNLRSRTERDEPRLRAMTEDFHQVTALHDHPLAYGIPEMGRHAHFLLGEPGAPRPPLVPMGERYGDGTVPPVSGDLRDDLVRCVDAVTGAGFDVVVVDQTLPEQRGLGLRTVSVLVPGLLPIDFGWSRQRALGMPRLRTALREAGLRERDLTPADLNPAPHPFP
ncbi:TOMM precursor leader peptide-binding protein [Streptomyces pacificus]|uniref:TOMM leader peptide-binding protein n=1 Tax=Streptomyces pacificus TaxID=2705029 RepID=A0A6A0AZZ1_9ACTN|nr:TOMM precursor leader peptide-binding protein [Streptomyces pacificus]GFH38038.1 TOMM precursor leader peptide-binding protein [Streptomyces pacificus]